jgi:glutamate--cysteine ligase
MNAPLDRNALLDTFATYGRPREDWLVGAELERHLLGPDGSPAPYFGEHGVAWLLDQLAAEGWAPYREGEHVIALTRDGASVTLEPGAQFELSGRPHATLAGLAREATQFAKDVARILAPTPYRQVALGFTPFADVHAIPWVPKGRYAIMREHMQLAGTHGHHMMKGTAATQASYDFSDERDCAAKVQLAIRMAPLVTAMFANSPWEHGGRVPYKSFRGFIWTRTDPARTGFPEAASNFSFERWVDYLLDAPMMFTRKAGVWRPARGMTFRHWMDRGDGDGDRPTMADWDLHQTSVFPEVRVKQVIEMRMADCVSVPEVVAFSALFKGLLYGAAGGGAAEELAGRFCAHGTHAERFMLACEHGLDASLGGRTMAAWADELVELARIGLARVAPDEAGLLDDLFVRVNEGVTPADRALALLGDRPDPRKLAATLGPLG